MKRKIRKTIKLLNRALKKLNSAYSGYAYDNNISYDINTEIKRIETSISELKFLL